MESVRVQINRRHLRISDLPTFFIRVLIKLTIHLKPLLSFCVANQFDNRAIVMQGFTSPIQRDKAEQAVLNSIPFAGAGWKVADADRDTQLVTELL